MVDGIHLQAYIKAKLEGEKDEKAREALLKELSSTIAEASRLMLSRYTYVPLLVEIATEHSEHVQKAYEQLIYGTREGWNLPEVQRKHLQDLVQAKADGHFPTLVRNHAASVAAEALGAKLAADVHGGVTGGSSGEYEWYVIVVVNAIWLGEQIVHGAEEVIHWVEGAVSTIGHWLGIG
ncbi:hypothetical protein Plo01_50330 [Planobispora longispora]|uniref:Uncharacterized protein n=1 Tax=Planobispora longispora TaxID=28887 RepID=A0A8J3W6K6_9ACTN|nr:hypothetical protein Plo01_50330 [Planobispora longispora]